MGPFAELEIVTNSKDGHHGDVAGTLEAANLPTAPVYPDQPLELLDMACEIFRPVSVRGLITVPGQMYHIKPRLSPEDKV